MSLTLTCQLRQAQPQGASAVLPRLGCAANVLVAGAAGGCAMGLPPLPHQVQCCVLRERHAALHTFDLLGWSCEVIHGVAKQDPCGR